MKRRVLSSLLLFALAVSLPACEWPKLARSDDTLVNVMLWIQRADRGVDAASAAAHTMHCVKCETHLLSKDSELALQERFLLATEWFAKAFEIIDAARHTKTLRLTTDSRSSLDTYLNGVDGALSLNDHPGINSAVMIGLNALLIPVRADIKRLRDKFATMQLLARDGAVEIELTAAQWQAIADAKAANQDVRKTMTARARMAGRSDEVEAVVR
jgi:hypothetical protein